MKKFLILYRSSVSAMEQMSKSTPEQAKAGMEMWVTATSSAPSDDKIGGFSILQAESQQALAEVLKGHPHFMAPGASVEVVEFLPMPGM